MTTELTPEFTTSLRGYDRIQVDDYVDTLREWLDAATARMQAAEADAAQLRDQMMRLRQRVAELEADAGQQPPRSLHALGDRVTRILTLAEEGAQAVQANAEATAAGIVAQAHQDVEELTRSTRTRQAEVEAWLAQTSRQGDQLVAQAEERAAAVAVQRTTDAEAQAAAMQASAEQRAAELIGQAESEATGLIEAARAERARTLQELAARREELSDNIRSLEAQRDEVLAALTGLRESLHRTIGQLPSTVTAVSAADQPDEDATEASPPPPTQPERPEPKASRESQRPSGRRPDDTLLFDQNEVTEAAESQ